MVIAFTVVLGGCQSSKQIPYFTNIDSISLEASRGLFDAKIMPKDMLTITVHTTDRCVGPSTWPYKALWAQAEVSRQTLVTCRDIW